MIDRLSANDAKWIKDAQAEFIARVDGKEIAALRRQNAELKAALAYIERQTEPRYNMPEVAIGICSTVNGIASRALAAARQSQGSGK